jgi:hypothetical protein
LITLGVDESSLPLVNPAHVGQEIPRELIPHQLNNVTIKEICVLICWYNEDFGIDIHDWGREGANAKFVEWLKV